MNNSRQRTLAENSAIEEVYFSVDVEADGPIPGPYSMSSFAIVASGYRQKGNILVNLDLDREENCFYRELKPISDKFDPEAAAIAGLDREDLILNGADPKDAMVDASAFIQGIVAKLEGVAEGSKGNVRPVFMGWPVSYDWLFTYWYFMNFNYTTEPLTAYSPFGHSSAIDLKSVFATKANIPLRRVGKRMIPKELQSKRRHTHNALDDARGQGELGMNILRWEPPVF